jgi:hypothetical protein
MCHRGARLEPRHAQAGWGKPSESLPAVAKDLLFLLALLYGIASASETQLKASDLNHTQSLAGS